MNGVAVGTTVGVEVMVGIRVGVTVPVITKVGVIVGVCVIVGVGVKVGPPWVGLGVIVQVGVGVRGTVLVGEGMAVRVASGMYPSMSLTLACTSASVTTMPRAVASCCAILASIRNCSELSAIAEVLANVVFNWSAWVR